MNSQKNNLTRWVQELPEIWFELGDANGILVNMEQMSVQALYACLKLRSDIFVVEQNCVYPDLDGLDLESRHMLAIDPANGEQVGYLRLLPAGSSFEEASIGRFCVAASRRKQGLGRKMIQKALHIMFEEGEEAIRIHGQAYLKDFYESLGFRPTGEPFDEDGIPHIEFLIRKDRS